MIFSNRVIKHAIKAGALKISIMLFYISGIAVHSMVIMKIIPYDWVNGGMSSSYKTQAVQSVVSIAAIAGLSIFVLKITGTKNAVKRRYLNALYVITFFWLLGLLMQLAGTTFERYFLSFMLLLGVVSHALLINKLRHVKKTVG